MYRDTMLTRAVFAAGALLLVVLLSSLSSNGWSGDVSAQGATVPSRTPILPPATNTPVPEQPTALSSATPIPTATPQPILSPAAELPAVGTLEGITLRGGPAILPW